MTRTDVGREFSRRWRARPYTGVVINQEGHLTCTRAFDDAKTSYLYQNYDGSLCTGLNFTSYSDDLSELNQYALLTYDAATLLFHAIDYAIRNNHHLNGQTLRDIINHNISFDGVSGFVKLSPGKIQQDDYGRGDREYGVVYQLLNFNIEQRRISNTSSFQPIYLWTTEDGILLCDAAMGCSSPIYRNDDNAIPSDTPPVIVVNMGHEYHVILIIIAALIWLLSVCCVVGMRYFSKKKLMKASQPIMLYTILAGHIFAGIRLIIATLPITTETCISGLWFGHLAFILVFGGLFLKTWRVHCLINFAFKRVKITNTQMAQMMAGIVGCMIVFMLLFTFVGDIHEGALVTFEANQETNYSKCAYLYGEFQTVLFAIEAIILVYGMKLCYAIKDLPDAINESKFIAFALTAITMISILVFPIVFLMDFKPPVQQFVASSGIGLASLITIVVVFAPKFSILYYGKDVDANFGFKMQTPKSKFHKNKVAASGGQGEGTPDVSVSSGLNVRATVLQLVKGKTGEERQMYIMQQIHEWQRALLQQSDAYGRSSFQSQNSSNLIDQIENNFNKIKEARSINSAGGRVQSSHLSSS